MRKHFLSIFLILIVANTVQAQTRGTKVGFIDMEYILQNVPDYTEAQNQLEQKAQKWKQEIEAKKIEINKLKEALKAEKALLTKGLIEERIAEIVFLENETLDYQQKRFGPNGDLMSQKAGLTKPIQDQVFTAVQDIAEAKKYDFIFDKTSDMTMLFAAKRFDISDQIIRVLNRTEKREQLTKKQLKEEEAKEIQQDALDENPALSSRQNALDAKKAARDKVIADRILLQEERKKTAEDKRLQILADREAKKSGLAPASSKTAPTNIGNEVEKEATKTAAAEAKQKQLEERALILEARKKAVEDNKKAQEEKRKQILADREAKKTGTVPSTAKSATVDPAVNSTEKEAAKTASEEAKQKQIDARAKTLEDRKKLAEDNKKAQEEKRKQALEEKEAKKTGTVSESTIKEVEKTTDTVAEPAKEAPKTAAEEAKQKQAEARAKTLEDRKKVIEDRKKALEEKRLKILEDREAAKKANEEKLKLTKENTNNN
jgi:Skp family chaperone for outer membrane proteins